jgi:ribosomal protein S18 acetylase RimI-like enzyme
MRVRPYEPDDRAAVLALAPRLTEGVAPWRDAGAARAAATAWLEGATSGTAERDDEVLVAVERDAVVGVVTVGRRRHWTGEIDAHVGELAVALDAQGLGVGRALMARAQDWAQGCGLARLVIETGAANQPARAFYKALGYVEEEVTLSRGLTRE